MADSFGYQGEYDYEKELWSLVSDFAMKANSDRGSLFYDLDDWLDIIDYFFAEEPENNLLKIALEKANQCYPSHVQIIIRQAHYAALFNPHTAYAQLKTETAFQNANSPQEISDSALINYQKGKILIQIGECDRALEVLQRTLAVSQNPFVYEQIATAFLKKKDAKRAVAFTLKALTESRKNIRKDGFMAYGAGDFLFLDTVFSDNLLSVAAKLYSAYPAFQKQIANFVEDLVKDQPFSSDYWEALAEFYFRAGEYEKADEAYDYCLSLHPSDLGIYHKKLQIYSNTFDKRKICELLERILPKMQQEVERAEDFEAKTHMIDFWKSGLRELIEGSIALKWYDKCINVCFKVLETNKVYPICDGENFFSKGEILIFISRAFQGLNEFDKALKLAMQAVELEPEYYGHRIHFAELLYDCGDVAQGEEVFQTLYEYCCEQSAQTDFKDKEERDTALYFRKHKYYVVASWAVKMAENSRFQEAMSLIGSNLPPREECFDTETFVLQCATVQILSRSKEMKSDTMELIESMVCNGGYSLEAILHRIPSLAQDRELMLEIQKLKHKLDNDEDN